MESSKPNIPKLRSEKKILKELPELVSDLQQYNKHQNGQAWNRSTDGQVSYFSKEYDDEHVSFAKLESWGSVRNRLDQMRMTKDTHIIGLDLMGQGNPCVELGCDYTLALTLPIPEYPISDQDTEDKGRLGIELTNGDIFNPKVTKEYMRKLDAILSVKNNKLGLVFFRPWGGIVAYRHNEYAMRYLIQHYLYPIYNRLATNGVMFIELHAVSDRLFTQLTTYLTNKGIWVNTIHIKDSGESGDGTRLLRIEKPMVSTPKLP